MIAALVLVLLLGGHIAQTAIMGALVLLINLASMVLLLYLFASSSEKSGWLSYAQRAADGILTTLFGGFFRKRLVDAVITGLTLIIGAITGAVTTAAVVAMFGLLTSIVTSCLPDYIGKYGDPLQALERKLTHTDTIPTTA